MDSAQFDYLIKLVIAVIGSYTLVLGSIAGVVVAIVKRSNGKSKSPYNGEERRAFKAAIDAHIVNCPNITRLEKVVTDGFTHLGTMLETHRNQPHG